MRKLAFCICQNYGTDQCLCFGFILQSLYFLSPKFQASSQFLWLYSLVYLPWLGTMNTGFHAMWLITLSLNTCSHYKCFHVLQEINMGQKASDTRGITFEDVEVPVEVGTVPT